MNTQRFGWRPDMPDVRDFAYAAHHPTLSALPMRVDLRTTNWLPGVYDQGELGSCTANAIAAAIEYDRQRQALGDFLPSRLFIYYGERNMEGTVGQDAGAEIRDGVKFVSNSGVCPESVWPYNPSWFSTKPSDEAYTSALADCVKSYSRLDSQDLRSLKSCIATGDPFVFGFTVYSDFESDIVARTGKLNLPGSGETPIGGHAVLAVGYNDDDQRFIVRNSWGASWGQGGYFTMPYEYITNPNLADDFWHLSSVGYGPKVG